MKAYCIHVYCVYVIVQVASSDQVLDVEITRFENLYNSEVRFGNYCCCDEPDSSCVEKLESLQNCPTACDPFQRTF